jgi:hypothetical protein
MTIVRISRSDFLDDRQGRTFADVANDHSQPFDLLLKFFSDVDRQRRMEESELHHDRAPLAGIVRELESLPPVDVALANGDSVRSKRLRQAIGVLVRMVMQRRGWKKTGRKGSLGVRSSRNAKAPFHNSGGLAFWFLRAERYELEVGMPYRSVRERCKELGQRASGVTIHKSPTKSVQKRQR